MSLTDIEVPVLNTTNPHYKQFLIVRWIGRSPRFSVATGLGAEEGKVKQAIACGLARSDDPLFERVCQLGYQSFQ